MGSRKKFFIKALLMSTHNISFHREIRKLLCGYPYNGTMPPNKTYRGLALPSMACGKKDLASLEASSGSKFFIGHVLFFFPSYWEVT